ncbi:disease resistance protein RPV1 isoform X2 [Ziziphus jujuba]|uniref:Disease resistance protein RPV1 isoform X2 n=1 Tax=Ziziphus jujuba TaxID=326968 RepID=A0ABM4A5S1_ZIZJJ|nr:disease resistance protein RPV1 isoform X2 [Ziziphus jujuba]
MFLDIACFITGEVYREEVENMFSCSDQYDVTIEITTLIDKSLLTESLYGCLSMHDLLREMGQAIVCDESKIPGNRSRLWTAKDVRHVLEKNKGTNAIQGISLNLSDCGIKKKVQVSPTTFSNMCHLRYLKIYGGGKQYDGEFGPRYLQVPENPFDISDELIYFHWDSYPLKYMPNFSPENLVGLIMRWSKLDKLWNEVELLDLEKLKKIDLSNSEHLTGIPSLSGAINLEIIDLQGCKNLVQIHLNLRNLCKLQILNLRHCYNLEKWEASESQEVPSSVPIGLDFSYCTGDRNRRILRNEVQLKIDASYCEHLTEIPNLSEAINLETITLQGCKSLVQVALNFQNHPMLRLLDLRECANLEECRDSENITTNNTTFIEEETSSSVPVELNFSNCKRLRSIPESIGKLKYPNLHLSECPNLEKFPEISSGGMECLHELSLNGTGIKELPESIENIKKLKQLSLNDCKRLKSLPQSIWKLKYLERLIVFDCPNLQGKFPEIWDVMECLDEIDLEGTGIEELPESIENIKKLKYLNLKDCKRLKSLPQSIWKLKYLEKLIVCACPNLQGKFPEIWDVMECLYEIDLEGTGIEELPESIENLTGLTNLNLCSCPQIKFLPKSLCKLSRLATLNLKECSSLEELPRLPLNLTSLFINYCESLKSIQQLPSSLLMFDAADCTSMKTISSCEAAHIHNGQYFGGLLPMVWRFENCLDLDYNTRNHIIADTLDGRIYDGCACPFVDIVYPGNEIPKWFNNRMRAVLLKYNINFKTNTCDGHRHKYIGGLAKTCLQANNRNADHVFIMHNRDMSLDKQVLRQLIRPRGCLNLRNVDALQASFSICLMEGASVNLNIKNCGIRFIYDYDRTKVRQY